MKTKRKSTFIKFIQSSMPSIYVLLILSLWEGLARSGTIAVLFFPSPSSILTTLWHLIISGEVFSNLEISLVRMSWGIFFGLVPGVLLGLAMGWSNRIQKIMDPFIAALHPIPKIAIFPLIMIIFGLGEISKIVAIAISAFFPMLINSMAGVRQLTPVYFEVAKNYGANRWKTFFRIVLPGSLPMILAGARIAFNMALVITIAVELLTAREGLGVMIWFAWETLRTKELYATLVVIAALGMGINYLLQKATALMTPWHRSNSTE